MAKKTIAVFGTLKVKMDIGSTDSHDEKKPHVSFEVHGHEICSHIYLDKVDGWCATTRDEKDALYWLQKHKEELKREYNALNP